MSHSAISNRERQFLAALYALSIRFPFDDRVPLLSIPECKDKNALIEKFRVKSEDKKNPSGLFDVDDHTDRGGGYIRLNRPRFKRVLHPMVRYGARLRQIAIADSVRCVIAMLLSFASASILTLLAGSSLEEVGATFQTFARDVRYPLLVLLVSVLVFLPSHWGLWLLRGMPRVRMLYRDALWSQRTRAVALTTLLETIPFIITFLVLYMLYQYIHTVRYPIVTTTISICCIFLCGFSSYVRMLPAPILKDVRPVRDAILGAVVLLAIASSLNFVTWLGSTDSNLPPALRPREHGPSDRDSMSESTLEHKSPEGVPFTLERVFASFSAIVVLLTSGPSKLHYRLLPWKESDNE